MGVDGVNFACIARQVSPGCLQNTRDEKERRSGIGPLHPSVQQKGQQLACQFWWGAPNCRLVKKKMRLSRLVPRTVDPSLIPVGKGRKGFPHQAGIKGNWVEDSLS